jgi:Tfp pilus assembly protein PilN
MPSPLSQPQTASGSFLPEDYITRKAEMRASFFTLVLFGVVMFGVVAAFFVTNRQWLTVRSEQEAINVLYTQEAQKIDQLKSLETQKRQMLNRAEVTTALLEKVPRSVLLAELVTRMPREVVLLDLELTSKRIVETTDPTKGGTTGPVKVKSLVPPPVRSGEAVRPGAPPPKKPAAAPAKAPAGDGAVEEEPKVLPPRFEYTLALTGVAKVNNDIADYLQSLKACTLLEKVDLQYITETKIGETEMRKFQIVAGIRKDADARSVLATAPAQLTPGVGAGPGSGAPLTAAPEPQGAGGGGK